MKILLITGQSGSGKTTICQELCKDDRYNFVNSYTDREMRETNEWGHIFVEPSYMDMLLDRTDIVAQTDIEGKRYCTLESQFDNNSVNVYTVDANGINDVIDAFPFADIMTILIERKDVIIDCSRTGRDVCVPAREEVDFLLTNNYKISSVVETIKLLVGCDFFNKPSHKVVSLHDKIKQVEAQERYLLDIKESLLKQLWKLNQSAYKRLINYVSEQVNNEFDFEIVINADEEPDIHEGYLYFNVIGEYTDGDVQWAIMDNLVARLSYHSARFCKEHGYDDLSYRLHVSECYVEEDGFL